MSSETTSLVAKGAISKGDVLSVARVAGIQAAKRASDLIPLCHPLLVGAVLVNFGKTWLTGALPEVWLFALGALFVVVTLLLPKGIVGLWGQMKTRSQARKARAPA